MSRIPKVKALGPEQQAKVDALIRHFRYFNLDAIRELLAADDILIPRSTLGRYVAALRERDGLIPRGEDRTVIVVFDRATGSATTVTSPASKDAVLASISSLERPL